MQTLLKIFLTVFLLCIIGNCGICKKLITDEGMTAFGKFYHKDCFKCCVCKQKISGKFFERGGKPYCAKDFAVSMPNYLEH